jgi:hypothetical protein
VDRKKTLVEVAGKVTRPCRHDAGAQIERKIQRRRAFDGDRAMQRIDRGPTINRKSLTGWAARWSLERVITGGLVAGRVRFDEALAKQIPASICHFTAWANAR